MAGVNDNFNQNSHRRKKILDDGIFEIELDDCDSNNSQPPIDTPNGGNGDTNTSFDNVTSHSVDSNTTEPILSDKPLFKNSITDFLNEIDQLKEEIARLKSEKCQTCEPKTTDPLLRIWFRNSVLADSLENELRLTINRALRGETVFNYVSELEVEVYDGKCALVDNVDSPKTDIIDVDDPDFTLSNLVVLDSTSFVDEVREENEPEEDVSNLISFDTKPDDLKNKTPQFPLYQKKTDDKNDNGKGKMNKQECFNCGGEHRLPECKVPKNFGRINAARQKFQESSMKFGITSGRYHAEDDSKYSQFKPGKISSQLRRALGLKANEVPFHIYKMRLLGYPPGWAAEADEYSKSILNIITDPQERMNQENDLSENVVHEYPGFNVPLEPGFKDDHFRYNMPPYQESQSKSAYFRQLRQFKEVQSTNVIAPVVNEVDDMEVVPVEDDTVNISDSTVEDIDVVSTDESKESSKKRLSSESDEKPPKKIKEDIIDLESQSSNSNSTIDIETLSEDVTSNPPLPKELPPPVEIPPPPPTEDPTITDLTENEVSETTPKPTDLVPSEDVLSISSTDESVVEVTHSESAPIPIPTSSSLPHTPTQPVLSAKSVEQRTPVLYRLSSYSTLPKSESFGKDMVPIINFENLPDTEGQYDKMKNVLGKVRDKLQKIVNKKT